MKWSAEQICKDINEGAAAAEGALYEQYIELAMSEARRWMRYRPDAKDIAHEALIVVLRRLREEGILQPSKLEAFTRRTVKYMSLAFLRRHAFSRTSSIDAVRGQYLSEDVDGFVAVARAEIDNRVVCLIEKLAQERDRRLLMRHYLEDVPKHELCAQFDLAPEQFDRVIHRARQRLRKKIETSAPDLAEEYC